MPARFDAVGVFVEDIPRALAFYRELGLDLPPEADDEPHVDFAPAGGPRLMFHTVDTIRSFDPDWQAPPHGAHRVELAFAIDTPAEIDAIYERLTALGHEGHKAPWDAFWGQRYAVLYDPDGNRVSLFSALG